MKRKSENKELSLTRLPMLDSDRQILKYCNVSELETVSCGLERWWTMYCDVCGLSGGFHYEGCPESHTNEKSFAICDECGEGIYEDEEYVENENGNMMHFHCCHGLRTRELIQWLGFEIERMKDYG